jgi:hypothetical protein
LLNVWSRPSCICDIFLFKVQWDRCHQDRRQAWNYINEITFLYIWKAPARWLRHTSKCRRVSADYLLKNASTKHNKYVLNPKLEHFDKKVGYFLGILRSSDQLHIWFIHLFQDAPVFGVNVSHSGNTKSSFYTTWS